MVEKRVKYDLSHIQTTCFCCLCEVTRCSKCYLKITPGVTFFCGPDNYNKHLCVECHNKYLKEKLDPRFNRVHRARKSLFTKKACLITGNGVFGGFRINAILPGGITTPGTKAVAKEVARFKTGPLKTGMELAMRLPLRRGGQPVEVTRIALVLASDLSSYVHGALIPVDGGFLSA